MMSRMSLVSSSSCVCVVVVFLLCLISHECNGRHLSSIDDQHAIDDKAKLLSHSSMKGFEKDPVLKVDDDDDDHKQTADSGSKKKKDQRVKKFKEEVVVDGEHDHHPNKGSTTTNFRVPSKKKRVHDQQPGFNLDYSPPKTHPPSHN